MTLTIEEENSFVGLGVNVTALVVSNLGRHPPLSRGDRRCDGSRTKPI